MVNTTKMELLVLLVSLFHSGLALSQELLGPVSIRDMSPISVGRLDLKEARTKRNSPGSWDFQVGVSHANTLIMSDNVERYLEQRETPGRRLSDADIDELLALPGEVYLFDGALTVTIGMVP